MNRHWIVLAVGAIFIPAAAGIRSGQRIQAATPTMPQQAVTTATPTRPSLWTQINDALESWEDAFPIPESTVSEGGVHESVTYESLIACPKEDDPHGPLVRTWIDWRRQALAALPESLRHDSDHRKAIDATYQQALRGFLTEEVAASYDPEEMDTSIISRPPVGGYDIGGVGFTDIDERAEVTDRDGGRTQDFWQVLMKDAINALPENLREGSQYREAIETHFQSVTSTEQEEHWNQIAAEAAAARKAALVVQVR